MSNKASRDADSYPLLTDKQDTLITPNASPDPTNRIFYQNFPLKTTVFKDDPDNAEEEVLQTPQSWIDFEKYTSCGLSWETRERSMSEFFEINKIIKYFYNELVVKKTPFREVKIAPTLLVGYDDGISILERIEDFQSRYNLLKQRKYRWQDESEGTIYDLLQLLSGHTEFYYAIDCQYINTILFQLLFPLDLIDMFVSVVHRNDNNPEMFWTIEAFQTALMEVFLWHHLKSDFKFDPILTTANLSIIDPFLRNLIRSRAQNKITAKYFNDKFNLKRFALKLLNLYFPTAAKSYLIENHKMQLWALQLIQMMFKLGLWKHEDLDDLITVLIQKLENLCIFEKTYYEKFLGIGIHLQNRYKEYFVKCREKVTSICIHIVVLINDTSLVNSFHLFNKKQNYKHTTELWKDAHFCNSDLSEKIMRLLTDFIMKTKVDNAELEFTAPTLQKISDLLKLMTSIENEMFYVSSKVVTDATLDFYSKPIPDITDNKANALTKKLTFLLSELSNCFTDEARLNIQEKIIIQLDAIESEIAINEESLKYVLALNCLPNVILSIFNMVVFLNNFKRCEDKCSSVLGRLLNGNVIGQMIIFDDAGMKHFKILFEFRPYSAIVLIESIFKDNYHLLYIQKSLCELFFGFFRILDDKLMYNFKTISIEWRGKHIDDCINEQQEDQEENFFYDCHSSNLFQSSDGKISGKLRYAGGMLGIGNVDGNVDEDGKIIVKIVFSNGTLSHEGKLNSNGNYKGKYKKNFNENFKKNFREYYERHNVDGKFIFATNMNVPTTNHDKKMKQLMTRTILSQDESKFELLLAYFMFCSWLINLIDQRDHSFDSKFMELSLQDIIESSFFNCMIKIIADQNFLPKSAAGDIDFQPHLPAASDKERQLVLICLVKRCENGGLNEVEAKGIMFEVAMMVFNLMNKACSRLYMHHVYKKVKTQLIGILENTEYLFGMTNGLEYRAAILELYTLFYVFPNNHLIVGRQQEFKSKAGDHSEDCITESHLVLENGIIEVIVKEVERAATKYDNCRRLNPDEGRHYLFKGLFPMIYKFLRGVFAYYIDYTNISTVKEIVTILESTLRKHSSAIITLFKVRMSFESTLGGSSFHSSFTLNGANTSQYDNYDARDWEEIQFPELHFLRNKIISMCDNIKAAYLDDSNEEIKKKFDDLVASTTAITVLTSKISFEKEPNLKKPELLDSHSKMLIEYSKNRSNKHMSNLSVFKIIMEEYKIRKRAKLTEAKHQDSMIQFLESDTSNTEAIVSFFAMITDSYFKRCLVGPWKDEEGRYIAIEPDGVEKAADRYIMTYLQNDIFHSYISFLDMILNDCLMLKEAVYNSCKDDEKGKGFLMIMNFVMINLSYLTIFKTFHNSDHKLLSERLVTLCSFFKNLCENNFQKFKKYFGETVPQLPNVQEYFIEGSSLMLDNGTRMMDIFLKKFNIESSRASNVLTLADSVQNYPNMQYLIRWVAECLCGPCKNNQNQLYKRTHDVFLNTVERVVDNVNSNLYGLKNTILDYFIALTEDNPEVVIYFAKFLTFDVLFTLMYTLLKRLYIYATVSQSKKLYSALVMKAEEVYTDKKNKSKKLKVEKNNPSEFSFYSSSSSLETKFSANISEGRNILFDTKNCSVITKEMEDFITVNRYEDILKVYLREAVFSEHILLQIVLKLNALLINFSKSPGAHNFNLDNVYQALINKYQDEVPMYIRKRFAGVEMNNAKDSDEKQVFYMFLTKITAEVELRNPVKRGATVKTLYQLLPCTFFLTDHTKFDFQTDIKHDEIVNSLVEKFDSFEIEMNDNLELYRRFPKLYTLSSDDSFWYFKLLLWSLGFVLNVLIVIFYRRDAKPDYLMLISGKHIEEYGQYPIFIISIIIFGLSLVALIMWMMARYHQKAKIISCEYHKKERMPLFGHNRILRFFIIYIWEPFHSQSYPIVFSFHVISCLLGILVNPFFLTLQLLCIVSISKTTNYVVQAITTHFDQMALTLFLAGLVIYSYSVLTSEYYFNSLESNTADNVVNCRYMWECLMYHINQGLRNDGGVGALTSAADPSDGAGRYVSKFFYDMVFFILVDVIALNIIFGITIDTFTTMREEYTERDEAHKTQCAVCRAKRIDIEREGENFEIHVKHDHKLWKYTSYMIYLKSKGREQLTGLEGNVWNNILGQKTMWIPHWTDDSDENTRKVIEKIEELDSKLELICKKVNVFFESEEKIDKKLDEKFEQMLKTIIENKDGSKLEALKIAEETPEEVSNKVEEKISKVEERDPNIPENIAKVEGKTLPIFQEEGFCDIEDL